MALRQRFSFNNVVLHHYTNDFLYQRNDQDTVIIKDTVTLPCECNGEEDLKKRPYCLLQLQ